MLKVYPHPPMQFIFYTFILHVLVELNNILGHFATFKGPRTNPWKISPLSKPFSMFKNSYNKTKLSYL